MSLKQIIGVGFHFGGKIDFRAISQYFQYFPTSAFFWKPFSNAKAVSKLAKIQLQEVVGLLSKLDEKFGEIASNAPPPVISQPEAKKTPINGSASAKKTPKGSSTTDGKVSRSTSASSSGGGPTGKRAPSGSKTKPANPRSGEAEKKRLKKELDKLMKAHSKANKMLDDFRNEKIESR